MKPLLVNTFAIALLASCTTPELAPDRVILASLVRSELSPKFVSAVPLEDREPFGSGWFEPVAPPIADAARVSVLNRSLLESDVYDIGETPFIGHLCHVALIGPSADVVALVSIINSESRCIIGEASRDSLGRIRRSTGGKRVAVQFDEFVRLIYDHLKWTALGFLEEQQKLFHLSDTL